jgi:GNAT superfamily N-acetyltransferase
MKLSFRDIFVFADLKKETNVFKHFSLDEVKDRYDSNFIEFKVMPSLRQFQEAEAYLKLFHHNRGQKFLKFVFPQDIILPIELIQYVKRQGYEMNYNEMYTIRPNVFLKDTTNPNVKVEYVTKETLPQYLALHYEDALQWGEKYAFDKRKMQIRDFKEQRKKQIIAIQNGEVIGSIDIIVKEHTVELDHFYVLPTYQRQGVGSSIQQFVMNEFVDKIMILVTDGQDTAREMYIKQGYCYIGKQYSILKTSIK